MSGKLSTDLALGGSVESPLLSGYLNLEEFTAEVPQVAIKIEQTELKAASSGQGPLQISGKSRSGGGELNIEGTLDPATRSFALKLKGDQFQVAGSSQLQATISPDLAVKMDTGGMDVRGELLIPKAYINANGGNSDIDTVGTSGDVVIVEENGQVEPETAGSNMTLDVNVVLGDDIKVEAGDFRGALQGNLQIEQTPELAPRGTGTIEVVNGDYVIYGQQLNMQRGKILFSGGPVDNPQLDMDVARSVDAYDVVAGARIRGTAQAPLLQLYSEPSMPDASIPFFYFARAASGNQRGELHVGKVSDTGSLCQLRDWPLQCREYF